MSDKANARILIADDQEGTRKALKALVESCTGCEVCAEATDGNQAIRKARRPAYVVDPL